MKELQQLVSYVNPRRLRRLAFYKSSSRGSESQLKKLYQAISLGKVNNDEEACQFIFKNATDRRYPKLKSRLKEQLANTTLLIDKGNQKADLFDYLFYKSRQKLFAAELLRRNNFYHAAFPLAKKALKLAEQASLSDIAARSCDILISYYAFVKRVPAMRSEYLQKAKDWHKKYKADYDAKLIFEYYTGFFINDMNFYGDLSLSLEESIKQLKLDYPKLDSLDFNYHFGFLEVMLAMNRAEYADVVEICQNQIELLKRKKVYPKPYVRNLLLQIISVSISTENFDTGDTAIRNYTESVPSGSRPWFRIKQLHTQLAITTKRYSLSIDLVNQVTGNRHYKDLVEPVKERIILLKAYVFWLGAIGKIPNRNENFTSFRLAKFLNSVPEFAKNRQGLHIPVLIVQALWLLHRRQYEKVRSRLAALRRYADRYLRNTKGTVRAYYFLRAFCQLADADFHRNGFLRKSEKNRKLLDQHPRSKVEQNVEVEIIPYESLYDLVVEQLDMKLH